MDSIIKQLALLAEAADDIWGQLRVANRLKTIELEARYVMDRSADDFSQAVQEKIEDAWAWRGGAR